MTFGWAIWITILAISAAGDIEYPWPLGKETPVQGTFGEYREGHFHTGIDFSTRGQTGWPVHAVADGDVYRLLDSLTGFGKAVYLRHRDGRVSVYAHLDRFHGAIASNVSAGRRTMSFRDRMDTAILPGRLAVRRGDVIGFSGESGSGLPHLHFELRADEESPINPMDFLPAPSDISPPKILSLSLLPASPDSRIDGVTQPVEFLFRPDAPHGFQIDTIPELAGPVWVHVTADDLTEPGGKYHLSPRRVEFSVDSGPVSVIEFGRLSYAAGENKRVGLIYDLAASHSGSGRYAFRLMTSLPRPAFLRATNQSMLDADALPAGRHRLRLVVVDAAGLVSDGTFSFVTRAAGAPPLSRISVRPDRESSVVVRSGETAVLSSPDGRARCELTGRGVYTSDPVSLLSAETTRIPIPHESTLPALWVYRLTPDGYPFAEPVPITVAHRGVRTPIEKCGVYRLHPVTRQWAFVGSKIDPDRREISAEIDRMGIYGLFDDQVPPRISAPRWVDTVEVRLDVSDHGSGVADTGSVRIDGQKLDEWYYDADRGWIRIFLSSLRRGRHRVSVVVADRIGNTARRNGSLTIH